MAGFMILVELRGHGGVRRRGLCLKFDPLCSHDDGLAGLQQPQRVSTHSSAGLPRARANVDQIRHIRKLIVPLGLASSLSEPVHRTQWSRSRDRGHGGLTHTSTVSGSVDHKRASAQTACGRAERPGWARFLLCEKFSLAVVITGDMQGSFFQERATCLRRCYISLFVRLLNDTFCKKKGPDQI